MSFFIHFLISSNNAGEVKKWERMDVEKKWWKSSHQVSSFSSAHVEDFEGVSRWVEFPIKVDWWIYSNTSSIINLFFIVGFRTVSYRLPEPIVSHNEVSSRVSLTFTSLLSPRRVGILLDCEQDFLSINLYSLEFLSPSINWKKKVYDDPQLLVPKNFLSSKF